MRKSAFTFIEILVAISVFAIGVLAVLRLITQNLVTLDLTQTRTTATFLAKEGIELAYNMRDSNIQKSLPRDCVLDLNLSADDFGIIDENNVCKRYFSSWAGDGSVLQIAFAPEGYIFTAPQEVGTGFTDLRETNRLYYTTGMVGDHELFRYSYLPGEEETATEFARYLRFLPVKENDIYLPTNAILKIESHVLYRKWNTTGDVLLESFIWNY